MFENIDILAFRLIDLIDSSFLDQLMIVLTSGYTWIPLYVALLYLVISNNETMPQICLIVFCAIMCVLFSGGINDYIVKPLVGRLRPLNDPMMINVISFLPHMSEKSYSFFSSHAANTFSLATFFSLLVSHKRMTIYMFLWAVLNGFTRLYLGYHYLSDVLAGSLWGLIVGFVCYAIYVKIFMKISNGGDFISTQYTSKGYTILTIDIVLLTLTAIIAFSIFNAFLMLR